MLEGRETILLDMNDTFVFGHDRFGEGENYGAYFKEIGGTLPEEDALSELASQYRLGLVADIWAPRPFEPLNGLFDNAPNEHYCAYRDVRKFVH